MRRGHSPAPLFCFPGNCGRASLFRPLVSRLHAGLGVQVVLYSELERAETPPSMEAFAASCLQAIKRVQPAGPYHLAGYSFGASVGYEVARQLRAAGEEIAVLALLEVEPGFASWPLGRRIACRKRQFISWIRSFFVRSPRSTHDQLQQKRDLVPDKIARIQTAAQPMLRNYQHRPYDGPVLLFRAVHGSRLTELFCRRGLAGGLEVFSVPGSHFTMLDEPNVSILAEVLQRRLREG